MNTRTVIANATLALVLASSAIATPATARTVDTDRATTQVSVKGLDLSSPEGIALLDRRVRAAAARVCPQSDAYDLAATLRQRKCLKQAIAAAQVQIAALRAGNSVQVASLTARIAQ